MSKVFTQVDLTNYHFHVKNKQNGERFLFEIKKKINSRQPHNLKQLKESAMLYKNDIKQSELMLKKYEGIEIQFDL